VNTLHKHSTTADDDRLATPDELRAWLAAQGLAEQAQVSAAELERARVLREELRVLLRANNEADVVTAAAWAAVDAASRRGRVGVRFSPEGPTLEAVAGGVDGALGRIVIAVYDALNDGTWARLKACRAPDCEWAFFDQAKNHSRTWCSMSSCGNRDKARAFRGRQRGSTP
jgi:predicted RNA-binding Zn ribbon-like protein